MNASDLVVPELGDFKEVSVVDVLVRPGDHVEVDQPLVTIETDKASMDVPSAASGTIVEVLVKRGDKIGKGSVIARVQTDVAQPAASTESSSAGTDSSTAIQPP